jgi:hypothetical protein
MSLWLASGFVINRCISMSLLVVELFYIFTHDAMLRVLVDFHSVWLMVLDWTVSYYICRLGAPSIRFTRILFRTYFAFRKSRDFDTFLKRWEMHGWFCLLIADLFTYLFAYADPWPHLFSQAKPMHSFFHLFCAMSWFLGHSCTYRIQFEGRGRAATIAYCGGLCACMYVCMYVMSAICSTGTLGWSETFIFTDGSIHLDEWNWRDLVGLRLRPCSWSTEIIVYDLDARVECRYSLPSCYLHASMNSVCVCMCWCVCVFSCSCCHTTMHCC